MSNSAEITIKDFSDLLTIFSKNAYEAGAIQEGTMEYEITHKCENLFKLDYNIIELENINGTMSTRYPGRIFIPEKELMPDISMITTIVPTYSNPFGFNGANNGCHNNPGTSPSPSPNRDVVNPDMVDVPLNSNEGNNSGNTGGIHAYVTFANSFQQAAQEQIRWEAAQLQEQKNQQQPQNKLQQNIINEDQSNINKIRNFIPLAKYARCRQRFAVPVIMYRGKYICRSATLSVLPEVFGRRLLNTIYTATGERTKAAVIDDENNDPAEMSIINQIIQSTNHYTEVLRNDVHLLNSLNVTTIIDLMVETRKIKYFLTVSSSEKADTENHYEHFNILSLPYPGCEFFQKFRDNNYTSRDLFYDWTLSFNNAGISIPGNGPASDLDILWSDYTKWDLVTISQNYLKAALKYIQEENSSMLVHCISGWDRTPLFISLVRLSLWADGLVHQSLTASQMTYFTVAYDWYLFGHQLPDRLKRSEDIMLFCFHVLKYITDAEFSLAPNQRRRTKTSSSSSNSSIVVLRTDHDEDFIREEEDGVNMEEDSNDSLSNDMVITDNFYASLQPPLTPTLPGTSNPLTSGTTTNTLLSRSPNAKRTRTSPISVPSAPRQRYESTSSTGSWNVVTETGSLESVSSAGPLNTSGGSGGVRPPKPPSTVRKHRLDMVRTYFVKHYSKVVGLKLNEGRGTMSNIINNIAERVF